MPVLPSVFLWDVLPMLLRTIEKLRFCVRAGVVICTRGNGRHNNPSAEFCRVVKLPINTPYTNHKNWTKCTNIEET
jgi:hypothetical protein